MDSNAFVKQWPISAMVGLRKNFCVVRDHDEWDEEDLASAIAKGNFLLHCVVGHRRLQERKLEEAYDAFSAAAREGSAEAIFNCGVMLEHGMGVLEANEEQAERLFRRAADRGLIEAKAKLGARMALRGLQEGFDALCDAAEKGHSQSAFDLAILCANRSPLVADASDQKTFNFLTDAGSLGLAEAKFALAVFYTSHPKAQPELAAHLAELAANSGWPQAYDLIAQFYLKGHGVKKSQEVALQFFLYAVHGNVVPSIRDAALLLETGSWESLGADTPLGKLIYATALKLCNEGGDDEDTAEEENANEPVPAGNSDVARLARENLYDSMHPCQINVKGLAVKLYEMGHTLGDATSTWRLAQRLEVIARFKDEEARSPVIEMYLEAAHKRCLPAMHHVLKNKLAPREREQALKLALIDMALKSEDPTEQIDARDAVKSLKLVRQCAVCSKTKFETGENLNPCDRCGSAYYCSTQCQRKDAKKHRGICVARPPKPKSAASTTKVQPKKSLGMRMIEH